MQHQFGRRRKAGKGKGDKCARLEVYLEVPQVELKRVDPCYLIGKTQVGNSARARRVNIIVELLTVDCRLHEVVATLLFSRFSTKFRGVPRVSQCFTFLHF